MDAFDVTTISNLMNIMSRIHFLTHELFVAGSILLIMGGIYGFFTQYRHNSSFLGIDHRYDRC